MTAMPPRVCGAVLRRPRLGADASLASPADLVRTAAVSARLSGQAYDYLDTT